MAHRPMLSFLQPAACSLKPALLVLLLAAASPAHAGGQAEDLLQEGKRLYALAQFEEALAALQKAAAAGGPMPTRTQVHLYQGLCQVELGDTRQARESFGAALDLAPDMKLDPRKFKRNACQLFAEVRSGRQGVLRVEASQAGGKVKLDGKEVGTVPYEGKVSAGPHRLEVRSADGSLGYVGTIQVKPRVQNNLVLELRPTGGRVSVSSSPRAAEILLDGELTSLTPTNDIPLQPGVHEVTVRLSGYQEQTRTLEIRAGEQVRLDLELKPLPAQEDAPPSQATSPEPAGEQDSAPGFWSRRRIWTWVALGTAGASAIAAGAVYGSASSDHEEYTTTQDRDRFYELESQIDDKLLASNILWGVTGALAATAVVLFFVEGRGSPDAKAQAIHLAPLVGQQTGLVLEGRF